VSICSPDEHCFLLITRYKRVLLVRSFSSRSLPDPEADAETRAASTFLMSSAHSRLAKALSTGSLFEQSLVYCRDTVSALFGLRIHFQLLRSQSLLGSGSQGGFDGKEVESTNRKKDKKKRKRSCFFKIQVKGFCSGSQGFPDFLASLEDSQPPW